jgi:hypothetical protein
MTLFDAHMVHTGNDVLFDYDVTTDGKRFLIDTTNATASSPPLTVVTNWTVGKK